MTSPTPAAALRGLALLVLAIGGTLACSGSAPGGDGPPDFTISLDAPSIVVALGGTAEVGVTITRTTPFVDSVTIEAGSLPAGVSASPVTLGSAADIATITFAAAADAPITFDASIVIRATAADVERQAAMELTVKPPSGSLDETFGTGGSVKAGFGVAAYGHAAVLDDQGRIVVAGASRLDGNYDVAVARFTADGPVDTSFGTVGITTIDSSSGGFDRALAVAVTADGHIVAAGQSAGNALVARFTPDGVPDATFGTNGVAVFDLGFGMNDYLFAVVVQEDGRIVAGGTAQFASNVHDAAIARLTTSGMLDPTFGTGGITIVDVNTDDAFNELLLVPEGVLAAGGGRDFLLARFTPDGVLDPAFGNGGLIATDLGAADEAFSLELTGGSVLLTGDQALAPGSNYDLALVRYDIDGSLDPTFGDGGIVTTDYGGYKERSDASALQEDGRIVMVGEGMLIGRMTRYHADGTMDETFAYAGSTHLDFNPHAVMMTSGVSKILVVGGGAEGIALQRYWP